MESKHDTIDRDLIYVIGLFLSFLDIFIDTFVRQTVFSDFEKQICENKNDATFYDKATKRSLLVTFFHAKGDNFVKYYFKWKMGM